MTEHTTFVEETDLDDDPETVDAVVHEDEATDPETAEVEEVAERGELVVREEEPENEMRSAIERAAEHAMENPGIPGRDEFLSLAAQARILCMSAAAPKEVQNDPHLAFHIAMIGRDLQISPSAALELIDVIPGTRGNPPQLSLSPQLLNGQIRRLGLGSIVPAVKTDRLCIAVVLGPNGRLDPRCKRTWPDHWRDETDPTARCGCRDLLGDYEFSWEDAQMAGLAGADCQPGEHTADCRNWVRGKSCNSGYKAYPKRMLWWRASGFAADDYFPEAGLGLYTAEELGAVVDADGRPIDPATAELPPGFEPEAIAPTSTARPNNPAPAETIEGFQKRIEAIKAHDGAADALRTIWTEEMDDGHPRLPPLPRLRESDVKKAEAAIASVEKRIERGDFGKAEETAEETPAGDEFEVGDSDPDAGPIDADVVEEDDGKSHTGDALVDEIVDAVKAMPLADVIDELGHRNLPVGGNESTKRHRLAEARYVERIGGSSDAPGESGTSDDGEDPDAENGAQEAVQPTLSADD